MKTCQDCVDKIDNNRKSPLRDFWDLTHYYNSRYVDVTLGDANETP